MDTTVGRLDFPELTRLFGETDAVARIRAQAAEAAEAQARLDALPISRGFRDYLERMSWGQMKRALLACEREAARPQRRRESHGARPGHRRRTVRTASRSGDSGDDDGSSSEPPPRRHLTLAPKPKATLSFGCSRCPECGGVLMWSAGELVCANRGCVLYGKGAA